MTVAVQAVLGALLQQPDTELYGLEIVKASGLEPGTIYPILQRLRGAGWVSDRWEDPEPGHTEGPAPTPLLPVDHGGPRPRRPLPATRPRPQRPEPVAHPTPLSR